MKRIKMMLFVMLVVFVLSSAVVVSAQGPTPQGQPPQGGQPQQGRGQGPQSQPGQGQGTQGQPGQGQGQMPQGMPAQGDLAGVVQTVSSASFTVLRSNNETFAAVISSTTKIELVVSQSAGTTSDILVGSNVNVEGRRNSDGSVNAVRIIIEPSGTRAVGPVSAVSGSTITLASQKDTITVVTTSSTKFLNGKDSGSLSDATKGKFVTAYGAKQSDGSISATYVIVNSGMGAPGQMPQGQGQPAAGQTPKAPTQGQASQGQPNPAVPAQGEWAGVVQTVSSSKLTALRANSGTFTVTINSTTTVTLMASQSTGNVSDIQVGSNVSVQGRPASNNTIAANRIVVEPSGTKVAGAVSAVSGATITLTSQKDKVTVVTSSSTTFLKGKETGSLTDVTKGVMVTAYGTKQSDGSISATYVFIGNGAADAPAPKQGGRSATGQTDDIESVLDQAMDQNQNPFNQFIQWVLARFK